MVLFMRHSVKLSVLYTVFMLSLAFRIAWNYRNSLIGHKFFPCLSFASDIMAKQPSSLVNCDYHRTRACVIRPNHCNLGISAGAVLWNAGFVRVYMSMNGNLRLHNFQVVSPCGTEFLPKNRLSG